MNLNITFRPVHKDEFREVAPLLYEAEPTMLNYCYQIKGPDDLGFLEFCIQDGHGFFGHHNVYVGVYPNGEIFTAFTLYLGKEYKRLTRQTIWLSIQYFGWWEIWKIIYRAFPLRTLFIPPMNTSLFWANASIKKMYRGKGLFREMHNFVISMAHTLQADRLGLDVSFHNTNALNIYTHMGFRTHAERPYHGKKNLTGVRRMYKMLNDVQEK